MAWRVERDPTKYKVGMRVRYRETAPSTVVRIDRANHWVVLDNGELLSMMPEDSPITIGLFSIFDEASAPVEATPPAIPYVERDPDKLRAGMVVHEVGAPPDTTWVLCQRVYDDRWLAKTWPADGFRSFFFPDEIRAGKVMVVELPNAEEPSPEMQVVASGQAQRGAIGGPAVHPSHAKPDLYVRTLNGLLACLHCGCPLDASVVRPVPREPCIPDPGWRSRQERVIADAHSRQSLIEQPRPLPYEPSLTGYGSLVGGPFRVRP